MSPGSFKMCPASVGWVYYQADGWQEWRTEVLHFSGFGPSQRQGKEKTENFHPLLFCLMSHLFLRCDM